MARPSLLIWVFGGQLEGAMGLRKRPFKSYLVPGRLQDVMALIQVLGLDEHAHRSEDGLQSELQGTPSSPW